MSQRKSVNVPRRNLSRSTSKSANSITRNTPKASSNKGVTKGSSMNFKSQLIKLG